MNKSSTLRILGVIVLLVLIAVAAVQIINRRPGKVEPQAGQGAAESSRAAGAPEAKKPAAESGQPQSAMFGKSPAWTPEMQKEVDQWMFSGEPVEGDCVTIHLQGNPNAINPISSSTNPDFQMLNLVFESYIYASWDLLPIPSEAASVTESDDHKVFTMKLDPRGKWQDGRPVTVDDIIFGYDMIKDPKNAAQAESDNVADIDRLEKVDDLTLRVHMKEAIAAGIWKATLPAVPKHAFLAEMEEFKKKGETWELKNSKLNQYPIGNGRYKLVSRATDNLVFERWEDYPFKKPYLKKIIYRIIPNEATAIQAFDAGEIDCLGRMTSRTFTEGTKDAQFQAVGRKMLIPELSFACLLWNLDGSKPCLTDIRVRKALAMSVNMPSIIHALGYDLPIQSNGIWSPAAWCYNPNVKVLPFDTEGARAILEEAGWKDTDGDGIREKDGQKLEFEILCYNNQTLIDILAAAADGMKKAGVNATLRPLEWTTVMDRLHAKDFQASYIAWSMGVDPDYSYNTWHSSQWEQGRNYGKYANPKVDELFDKGRRTYDFEQRKQIYQEIQKLIYDDQPALFMYSMPIRFAVNKRIKGVRLSPRDPFIFYPGVFGWWVPKELQKCKE
jgi:peptide/nickel transport system substrate-binding protein